MNFKTWFALKEEYFIIEWNNMSKTDQINFSPIDIASFYFDRNYDSIQKDYTFNQNISSMKMTTHYDKERESIIFTEKKSGFEIIFNKNEFTLSEIIKESDLIIGDTDESRKAMSNLYDSM